MLAVLVLAYAWHRLRCQRCEAARQRDRKRILAVIEQAHKTVRGRI
jgi:hypothetical protein